MPSSTSTGLIAFAARVAAAAVRRRREARSLAIESDSEMAPVARISRNFSSGTTSWRVAKPRTARRCADRRLSGDRRMNCPARSAGIAARTFSAGPAWTLATTCRTRSRSCFAIRSEEHTSELQSPYDLVCRLLLEKKKQQPPHDYHTIYNKTHH